MRNDASTWMRWRGVVFALPLLILALPMAGCGGSARSDVNLNRGESLDRDRPELMESFPDGADTLRAGAGDWVYRIQPGDQLEIAFFTHPDQDRFVNVRPDGRISLPYLGDVVAAGRAPEALAREIEAGYQDVLISPRVDVLVQEMGGSYYVLGEVKAAGEYDLDRPVSLIQAVAKAGGYTDQARLTQIVLLRRLEDGARAAAVLDLRGFMGDGQRQGDVRLQPYDIVWVPKDALSRWDNIAKKTFTGLLQGQDVVIKGWSLANFEQVYERNITSP